MTIATMVPGSTSQENHKFPDISLTNVKFPDFSRFSSAQWIISRHNTRDVNETRETRDLKKFLGIEKCREFTTVQ